MRTREAGSRLIHGLNRDPVGTCPSKRPALQSGDRVMVANRLSAFASALSAEQRATQSF
jgi:hypothetical protein